MISYAIQISVFGIKSIIKNKTKNQQIFFFIILSVNITGKITLKWTIEQNPN